MRIIESDEVRARLTPDVTISLMREALTKLESGEAVQPLRSVNSLPGGDSFGFMPAWTKDFFGAKIITAFHGNLGTEYPSHMGYVMLFESVHGAPVGMADASAITELRTGAVSAVATDLLARKDAKALAIIGCGAQGRSHLAAISRVRKLESVKCYDINPEAARRYAREQGEKYGIPVSVADSVEEAVRGADIVCTLTPSKEPYLKAEWIAPGTHVNAVGTFTPVTREATSELVAKSRLYADQVEAMKRESGEYLIPLKEGLITEAHIVGSIGAALLGKVPGRLTDEEITLFDALGLAIEDVTCAKYLLRQ
jgi:ornithine cyclodeaminase